MSWRIILIIAAAVVVTAVFAWLLVGRNPAPATSDPGVVEALPTATPAPEQRVVLLFPAADGLLHPELRVIPLPNEVVERVRVVMNELLKGSEGRLAPTVPYPAEVLGVYLDDRGSAFVDLTAPPEPLTGSHTELLLAYGVVDSVLLNCPELTAVQILFSGSEVPTLSGHLDLSRPLRLNKRFISAR